MHILLRLVSTALVIFLIPSLVPGVSVESYYIAFIVALLFGVASVTIKPLLFIITLPISILTFGLFSFVINAALLLVLSSFVTGFHVATFVDALLASVIIVAAQSVVNRFL